MRIEGKYPTPILGVSTLAPRNRIKGQAGKQINFRSDPVQRLTRRPSLTFSDDSKLIDSIVKGDVFHHSYERKGSIYRLILDKSSGVIYGFVNDSPVGVVGDISDYVGSNMAAQTIDHTTYFLNRDKKVVMLPNTDTSDIEKVSHINVTAALNYGETVQVNVTKSDGTRHTVSYSIPDLISSGDPNDPPDYDTADKARATKQVALELAARINGGGVHQSRVPNPDYPDFPTFDAGWNTYCVEYNAGGANGSYDPMQSVCQPYITDYDGITGVTAVALGSTVAVWEDGRAKWLDLEIETGQGDRSCVALNRTVENVEGFPLYAVVGTRITVRPDPTSEKGIYYLQAERTSDAPSGEHLEEVVWTETRNPTQAFRIDSATMPHQCLFDEGSGYVVDPVEWKDRLSGDDDSVKIPKFIEQTITDIGYFQKRLVFLTENFAIMSEADDERNFWRQSAVNLLVNDRVEISSSAVGIDALSHIVPHNRDLLIIAANGQFKIEGSSGITPQTISMFMTTRYECQTNVPPVAMGNSVFFPIDYGESTGIQEYTGERDTGQDFAAQITHHVVGLMQGSATLMTASPNLEMIAVKTTDSDRNQLYVYEQYSGRDRKRRQQSWSEWVFSGDAEIVDIEFRNDELTVISHEGTALYVKTIKMYSKATTGIDEVYMDDLYKADTDGLTATLPDGYVTTDIICVRGDNTDHELFKVQFTLDGNTLTFNEDIGEGVVYVGKPYESRYAPTRPFKYEEDGTTVTTDKLRVSRFILSLVDTNEINMHIVSDYYSTDDQQFNSRYLNGLQNKLGEVPFYTGDHKFSFAQDANLADAEFYCDNWLGCTISGISWEGQYYQSKGRM